MCLIEVEYQCIVNRIEKATNMLQLNRLYTDVFNFHTTYGDTVNEHVNILVERIERKELELSFAPNTTDALQT